MGKSRKKQDGTGTHRAWLVLFVVLVLTGTGIFFYLKEFAGSRERADLQAIYKVSGDEVAVILDNVLEEECGLWRENQAYMRLEWVQEWLNERFYWDASERLLIYALARSIVYMNEDTVGAKGHLFFCEGEEVWLSLALVAGYTDIRVEVFGEGEPKRAYIDVGLESCERAQVKRAGALREGAGRKSAVLTEMPRHEEVTVLAAGEEWSKVRTSDGFIGYTESGRLSGTYFYTPESTFKAEEYTSISMDGKVRLSFHQVTVAEGNASLERYANAAPEMNVIVPTWFNVTDNEGNYTSLADKDYVETAHALGLKVWAMVENVSTRESVRNLDSAVLMSSTSARSRLIERLMAEADSYGFDGFNLDFESLKPEAGPHYVQFIRELSVSCRNKGLVLSVDNYVPSAYTAFYDRGEQAAVADYIIIMGYDEHYAGDEAGSVASISFVRDGIVDTLKEAPKEKVINAVPFYTRVWTVAADKTTSKAYGITGAKNWVEENDVELTWDEEAGQYYGELSEEGKCQKIWMEEERSIALKVSLVNEYDLAGVACWKLGLADSSVWEIIGDVR